MKETLKDPFTYALIHLMIAIVTFGHAYNGVPDEETASFGVHTYTVHNGAGTKAFVGAVSGFFWPLYWSVHLQEK